MINFIHQAEQMYNLINAIINNRRMFNLQFLHAWKLACCITIDYNQRRQQNLEIQGNTWWSHQLIFEGICTYICTGSWVRDSLSLWERESTTKFLVETTKLLSNYPVKIRSYNEINIQEYGDLATVPCVEFPYKQLSQSNLIHELISFLLDTTDSHLYLYNCMKRHLQIAKPKFVAS